MKNLQYVQLLKSNNLNLKFFLLNCIYVLFFFIFSSSQASGSLNDAQEDEIYQYLQAKWQCVEYKQPNGFGTIFNELEPSLWPVLPESYEWRIEDDKVCLFKHKYAPKYNFDFVTYLTDSTDSSVRFNFLSRWDGVTHHSFTYTRQNSPLSSNDDARSVFPIGEFKFNGKTYMRGHCIDYIDTGGLSEISRVPYGTIIESISTLDPRNYIPEPRDPTPYWGETLRNNLVKRIRKENGCYAQYMYYDLPYKKTNDETATAIPQGIYFVEIDSDKSNRISYHVSWSDRIHEGKDTDDSDTVMQKLKAPKNFFPSPFINDFQENGNSFNKELLLNDKIIKIHSHQEYYQIVLSANYEVDNVLGKISLISYFLEQKHDSIKIKSWLKRLIEHAVIIHEKGRICFRDKATLKPLINDLKKDNNYKNFVNWLKWIDENHKRLINTKPIRVASDLPSLEIGSSSKTLNNKIIDIRSKRNAVNTVVNLLKKNPEKGIYLQNLTTEPAKKIAASLRADLTYDQRNSLRIQYSPYSDSTHTKGIRPAFTNAGISPTRVEPLKSSSSAGSPIILKSESIYKKNEFSIKIEEEYIRNEIVVNSDIEFEEEFIIINPNISKKKLINNKVDIISKKNKGAKTSGTESEEKTKAKSKSTHKTDSSSTKSTKKIEIKEEDQGSSTEPEEKAKAKSKSIHKTDSSSTKSIKEIKRKEDAKVSGTKSDEKTKAKSKPTHKTDSSSTKSTKEIKRKKAAKVSGTKPEEKTEAKSKSIHKTDSSSTKSTKEIKSKKATKVSSTESEEKTKAKSKSAHKIDSSSTKSTKEIKRKKVAKVSGTESEKKT